MKTAEEYAALAEDRTSQCGWRNDFQWKQSVIAQAQLYATLAQAAAMQEWLRYSQKLSEKLTGVDA